MLNNNATGPDGVVRPARPGDLPAVAQLCVAHAAYELADPVPADLAARLAPALFTRPPRLRCLVADASCEVVGYATYTLEFSTWRATEYVHLDCLFVLQEHRGAGWGRRLFDAVSADAATTGVTQVQWQTPHWNRNAIRFYDRTGAQRQLKARYQLPVAAAPVCGPPRE